MRSARGQATVDYVALIAVLAVLLGAALALATGGAPGIVNAVTGQIRHALCVVGGGRCRVLTRRPCAVATTRDAHHFAVNLLFLRIDHDRYVLREEMSDGTVRLTVARSGSLGAEAGVGARVSASLRGRRIGLSDEARAGAGGVLGFGTVFVARDEREAAVFMQAIRDGDDPPPPPHEDFVEGGTRGLGQIGIGSSLAGASVGGLAGQTLGGRRDRRTGAVTVTFGWGASGRHAVTIALGGPAAIADSATTLGLTLDKRGHPVELSLSAAGALAAGTATPPGLARALGSGDESSRTGGRRWELAARLDLRDRDVAAAWMRLRRDPTSGDAIAAIGAAIRDRAHLDVRTYATTGASDRVEGAVGAGPRLGGEFEHAIDSGRLLAASSRPPGGLWEQRVDCLRTAT